MNGRVYLDENTKTVIGSCKASELRGQFQDLKEFMLRIEAGG